MQQSTDYQSVYLHFFLSFGTNDVTDFPQVTWIISPPNCHLRFSTVVLETFNPGFSVALREGVPKHFNRLSIFWSARGRPSCTKGHHQQKIEELKKQGHPECFQGTALKRSIVHIQQFTPNKINKYLALKWNPSTIHSHRYPHKVNINRSRECDIPTKWFFVTREAL